MQNVPDTGSRQHERVKPSLFSMVLDLLATRSELACAEFKEAQINAVKTAVFGFAAALLALLATVFISVAVLIVCWDTYRIEAACAIAVFYLAASGIFLQKALAAKNALNASFTVTGRVLKEDIEALKTAAGPVEENHAEPR